MGRGFVVGTPGRPDLRNGWGLPCGREAPAGLRERSGVPATKVRAAGSGKWPGSPGSSSASLRPLAAAAGHAALSPFPPESEHLH